MMADAPGRRNEHAGARLRAEAKLEFGLDNAIELPTKVTMEFEAALTVGFALEAWAPSGLPSVAGDCEDGLENTSHCAGNRTRISLQRDLRLLDEPFEKTACVSYFCVTTFFQVVLRSTLDVEFPSEVSMDSTLRFSFNPKLTFDLAGNPVAQTEFEATREIQRHQSGDDDLQGTFRIELLPTLSFVFPPSIPVTLQPFVAWQIDFAASDLLPGQRRLLSTGGDLANTVNGEASARVQTPRRRLQVRASTTAAPPEEETTTAWSPEAVVATTAPVLGSGIEIGLAMTFRAGFKAYTAGFEEAVVGNVEDFVSMLLQRIEALVLAPVERILTVLERLMGTDVVSCFRAPIEAGVNAASTLIASILPTTNIPFLEPWFIYNRTFLEERADFSSE